MVEEKKEEEEKEEEQEALLLGFLQQFLVCFGVGQFEEGERRKITENRQKKSCRFPKARRERRRSLSLLPTAHRA